MNVSRKAWMDTGPLSKAQYEGTYPVPFVEYHHDNRDLIASFKMLPYFSYCRVRRDGSAYVIRLGLTTSLPWNHPWVFLPPQEIICQFALCA